MKRLLTLIALVVALMGLSASAATADACACGGATYSWWFTPAYGNPFNTYAPCSPGGAWYFASGGLYYCR